MKPDEEDIKRRIAADNALAHLRDQERLIDARAKEAQSILEPIRRRGLANHFMDEAKELMSRRIRGE